MKFKKYKIKYHTHLNDFNIRIVQGLSIGEAVRRFHSEFPEAVITECFEV